MQIGGCFYQGNIRLTKTTYIYSNGPLAFAQVGTGLDIHSHLKYCAQRVDTPTREAPLRHGGILLHEYLSGGCSVLSCSGCGFVCSAAL